jgi:hypothetical protein
LSFLAQTVQKWRPVEVKSRCRRHHRNHLIIEFTNKFGETRLGVYAASTKHCGDIVDVAGRGRTWQDVTSLV